MHISYKYDNLNKKKKSDSSLNKLLITSIHLQDFYK
jgi:hypothetical protein